MKRLFVYLFPFCVSIILLGCQGNGSSAQAPTNVAVQAGDTSATVTWDSLPQVEYWIFKAASSDVNPTSCIGLPQCQIYTKVVSPAVIYGLTNGTTYSFSINGRINGGKGGPGSKSNQAVPRVAGAVWSGGTSPGADDLHGVTYGTKFVAAGANGKLYSSTSGLTWTALTNPLPTTNLNAIIYSGGIYMAVGAGGVVLTSPDTITWTSQTSGTTQDLYAVSGNGSTGFVAVGANGKIIYSSDSGTTWNPSTFVSSNALFAITYGFGKFVAVGAAGTLITSSDGKDWTYPNTSLAASLSTTNLKAVSYGVANVKNSINNTYTLTPTFVVLGDGGTLVTNIDSVNWVLQSSPISTATINAVTFGHQFIAVDNIGGIYFSTDGLIWNLATSTPSNTTPLYAVTHGPYDFSTVGGNGVNLHSM